MTGSPKEFVVRIFENLVNDNNQVIVMGNKTKAALNADSLFARSVVIHPHEQEVDILVEDWHGRTIDVTGFIKSHYSPVSAIFIFPGRPILSEHAAATTAFVARHSPVIHWCEGQLGNLEEKFFESRGLARPYDIHMHFEKQSQFDYEVAVTALTPLRRSGTYKVEIPKLKTAYEIMGLNEVTSTLYDIHDNPDDPRRHMVKPLLVRFKDLTGQSMPGFMK
jgi:hypothetical protein